MDRVAVDLYVKEVSQFGGFQNSRAVLARGNDGDLEAELTQLPDKFDAPLVRLNPDVFNDLVDQVVFAVPEPAHRFGLCGIIWAALGQLDIAGCEKVANAGKAGFPINSEGVVRAAMKRKKFFAPLRRPFLKILVKLFFQTGRV